MSKKMSLQQQGISIDKKTALFDKEKWTVPQARKWLKEHGYKSNGKADSITDFHKIRLFIPAQTVMFDKQLWTIAQARKWLDEHGYKHDGKVDSSGDFHRFRQFPPSNLKNPKTVSFGTVSNGIKGVIDVS